MRVYTRLIVTRHGEKRVKFAYILKIASIAIPEELDIWEKGDFQMEEFYQRDSDKRE